MNQEEYEGWTNYETSIIGEYINSMESERDYWLSIAEDCKDDEEITGNNDALLTLSDLLMNHFETDTTRPEDSIWAAMIDAALSEVDWWDIAEELMTTLEKARALEGSINNRVVRQEVNG